MITEDLTFRNSVMLAFQVALLGMVPSTLRAVTVGWKDGKIASASSMGQSTTSMLNYARTLRPRLLHLSPIMTFM